MPGTKPQRADLYCRAAWASIPSAEATGIAWARYIQKKNTHTEPLCLEDTLLFTMWHWPDLNWPVSERPPNSDLQKILTDLAALQSPNSIIRAANVRVTLSKVFLQQDVSWILTLLSTLHRIWQKCAAAAGGWMLQSVQSHQLKYSWKCDVDISFFSTLHSHLSTTSCSCRTNTSLFLFVSLKQNHYIASFTCVWYSIVK